MSLFDTNMDGYIDINEFLVGIRGNLNAKRQEIVDKAFFKLDSDGSAEIDFADLRGVFDTSMHPKRLSGEMTEDEVFAEFLQSFGDKNRDESISYYEWIEHYNALSATIDNDE